MAGAIDAFTGRKKPKNGRVLKGIQKSLRIQSLTALALVLVSLPFGKVAAYSAFFGSLAVYLPGWLFTVLVARKIGGDSSAFLRTAALAEFGKLVLTGVLCAVVFIFVKPLAAGFFFLGMIGVLAAGWIGTALVFRG
jgi:F0F1-type ATP synthase assembly protein I